MNNQKETVLTVIAEGQDGKLRGVNVWNDFLNEVVEQNTTEGLIDYTDTEKVQDDLRYGIDQFQRALRAIEIAYPEN